MATFKRYVLLLCLIGGLPQCAGSDGDATPSSSAGGAGSGGTGMVSTSGTAGDHANAGASGGVSGGAGGGAGTISGSPDTGGAGGSGGAGGAGGAPATTPCTPSKAHTPGDSTETFDFGGYTRDYIVHVPTGYDGSKRLPVVVDLHGYTSWASEQAERTKWGT